MKTHKKSITHQPRARRGTPRGQPSRPPHQAPPPSPPNTIPPLSSVSLDLLKKEKEAQQEEQQDEEQQREQQQQQKQHPRPLPRCPDHGRTTHLALGAPSHSSWAPCSRPRRPSLLPPLTTQATTRRRQTCERAMATRSRARMAVRDNCGADVVARRRRRAHGSRRRLQLRGWPRRWLPYGVVVRGDHGEARTSPRAARYGATALCVCKSIKLWGGCIIRCSKWAFLAPIWNKDRIVSPTSDQYFLFVSFSRTAYAKCAVREIGANANNKK